MRAANAYSLPSNSFHMTLSWTFSAFSDLLLFVCLLFFFWGGEGSCLWVFFVVVGWEGQRHKK